MLPNKEKFQGYSVEDTAVWIAAMRAEESALPDRLFNDPFAAELVKKSGLADLIAKDFKGEGWSVSVRTKLLDDMLLAAIKKNNIEVVVNLGAGLDTRPYRLDLPADLLWIEADLPKVLLLKDEVLNNQTPRCQLNRIPGDLSQKVVREQLFSFIAQTKKPTLILTEALLLFLDKAAADGLSAELCRIPNVQAWLLEFCTDLLVAKIKKGTMGMMLHGPESFCFGVPHEQGVSYFSQFGWQEECTQFVVKQAQALKRPAINTIIGPESGGKASKYEQEMIAVSLFSKAA